MIDRLINKRGRGAIPTLVGFLVFGVCTTPVLGPIGQALARGGQQFQERGFEPGRQQGPPQGRQSDRIAPSRPAPSRSAPVHIAPSRPAPGRTAPVHVAPSRPAPVRPSPGIVSHLPAGHGRVEYRGRPYYVHGGRYYRPHGRGYVWVTPPRRMVVPWLPLGFATLLIAGITYYSYLGVYYQRVPTGYMVVAPPVGVAPAPPVVNTVYPSVTVLVAGLNVRQGPGSNYAVLAVVSLGDTLNVLATAPGWLYVQTATGQLGWVDQSFTTPFAPGASG
ncbi:MAG: DUF6515 family protein [Pseudomonadota bacterium]